MATNQDTSTPAPLRISRPLDEAIGVALNQLGAARGCKPIIWTASPTPQLSGQVSWGDYDTEAGRTVAESWAAALALSGPVESSGMYTWTGTVDRWPVEVWCVVDRDKFGFERA